MTAIEKAIIYNKLDNDYSSIEKYILDKYKKD